MPDISHTPKFDIIKKQTEPSKPAKKISVELNFLIIKPNETTTAKEIYVKNIVL